MKPSKPRNPAVAARKLAQAKAIARRCSRVGPDYKWPAWVRSLLDREAAAAAA